MKGAAASKRGSKDRRFIPLIRPSVGVEELKEIGAVLESGWLAQGPKTREFEREVATRLGAKYAVATSSCTTALSLAIESLQLEPKSEMIVPDFTFPATANVVVRAGSTPMLCDVDRRTFGILPDSIRSALTSRTSAIIPVHPFGHPYDMDEISELAAKRGCEVIQDAATAFGTRYKGTPIGASGRAVCFSFHPRKILTTAEGGCLLTDDHEVYERALAMRSHGQVSSGETGTKFVFNGLNYRMSDIHAAIGLAQLKKIDSVLESRRRQAKLYNELISSSRLDVETPIEEGWAHHTYQSYVIVLGSSARNSKVIPVLKEKFGIETQVGTYCLSVQPSFRRTARLAGSPINARLLYEKSLTLPLYQTLTESEQAYVVSSLASAVRT